MQAANILFVDDHEEVLEFLVSVFSIDYRVTTSASGEAALDLLSREIIDLVISDVMMPKMDGFELCRRIKTTPAISHVPVILLTAKNSLASRIEGLEIGADAYIEKPCSPLHLKAQVTNLLTSREKLRTYFATTPMAQAMSVAHTVIDQAFLESASSHILHHIENSDFGADELASAINMSRITLYRKIKAISDMTPHEFINVTRLKRAAQLLTDKRYRIYDVAMMVGYKSQSQFGKLFKKQFGVSPSEFVDSQHV